MVQMTVGDFKSRFSQVIASVIEGEEVEILYGRAKKPVAKVSNLSKNNQKRQIGTYDNIATFSEVGDSKITLEEFLSDVTFNIDNYSKVCREYQENSFSLEVDAYNEEGEIFSHKIPLKLEDNC